MQRRSFLQGAGVVTVVVVGGGVWRAYDQGVFSVGEGAAYEPGWEEGLAREGLAQRFERWSSRAGARGNSSGEPSQHAALALQGDEFVD